MPALLPPIALPKLPPIPPGPHTGIGLMSGSSLDGLDVALCLFHYQPNGSWVYDVLAAETLPFGPEWAQRLQALPTATAEELAHTHSAFGHWLGMQVRQFCVAHQAQPQWVASHGHTVFHQPHRMFTFQAGCPEALASHLPGVPVVANLRARDVALGGQGAPLVPFAEWHLFPQHALFLNLGGIANLSVLPRTPQQRAQLAQATWQGRQPQYLGWDVCGANQLLNALARTHNPSWAYDPSGQVAASGQPVPPLLHELLALPYAHLPPPKSLGNEDVRHTELHLLLQHPAPTSHRLHTAVEYIALRVAQELGRTGIGHTPLLVTGGGAHNAYLMQRLAQHLAPLGIVPECPSPLLVDYKEAVAFAFLGLHTLLRLPNTLPGATGARHTVSGGTVSYG